MVGPEEREWPVREVWEGPQEEGKLGLHQGLAEFPRNGGKVGGEALTSRLLLGKGET